MYDILELNKKLVNELRDIAKDLQVKRVEKYKKQDLIYKILDMQAILASEGKLKDTKPANPKISKTETPQNSDPDDDSLDKKRRSRVQKPDEKVTINSRSDASNKNEEIESKEKQIETPVTKREPDSVSQSANTKRENQPVQQKQLDRPARDQHLPKQNSALQRKPQIGRAHV